MAKTIKKKRVRSERISPFSIDWKKENYFIMIIGILFLIAGFFLMTKGPWDNPLSLSVSPVILLIAYLIIIPFAILYKGKKSKEDGSSQS